MKKIAILLITGGIFLILSLDATAGITYPRNEMSIFDQRLNDWPWEPALSNTSTPAYVAISPSVKQVEQTKSKISLFIIRFRLTFMGLSHLFLGHQELKSLEDAEVYTKSAIIRH